MPNSSSAPPRTVHVEECMGVFTIDIRDPGSWDSAIAAVVGWLHRVDATFSTYRPDSPVSRLGRGEIALADCPPDVGVVLEACAAAAARSDGYFTACPEGRLEPAALVKGWAIQRASDVLRAAGSANHAMSGGGDMQLAGQAAPDRPWRVGVAHPDHRDRLLTVVSGTDIAVATSGTAERGPHIVNPHTGQPATELRSLTVIGRDLTTVDADATAAFAMGAAARPWLSAQPGREAYALTASGLRWDTRDPVFAYRGRQQPSRRGVSGAQWSPGTAGRAHG